MLGSRSLSEALVTAQRDLQHAQREVERLHRDIERWGATVLTKDESIARLTEQNARLVELLAGMKRDGFVPQEPELPQEPEPALPSAIQQAIDSRAIDRPMAASLRRFALEALRSETTETEIAERIMHGEDPSVYLD